ncbi:hypothetical protein, partial [Segatella oris]|uniref:hypothetical protein n=1 Tax=Segatella oris TaxID=28135 RepID=UPI0028EE7894
MWSGICSPKRQFLHYFLSPIPSLSAHRCIEIAVRESASGNTERQAFHAAGYQLDNQQLTCYVLIS